MYKKAIDYLNIESQTIKIYPSQDDIIDFSCITDYPSIKCIVIFNMPISSKCCFSNIKEISKLKKIEKLTLCSSYIDDISFFV